MSPRDAIEQMLATNDVQRDWYNQRAAERASAERSSLRSARAAVRSFRSELGLDSMIIDLQWQWLAPLNQAEVLDLGCFTGNALSLAIARQARRYVGLDISTQAVERLNARLEGATRRSAFPRSWCA